MSVREHTGECSLHLGEIEVLDEAVGLCRVSSKAMKSPRTVSLSSSQLRGWLSSNLGIPDAALETDGRLVSGFSCKKRDSHVEPL